MGESYILGTALTRRRTGVARWALATALLTSVGVPELAVAQNQAGTLQDIIVTAQKKEENLQDIPVAVTALGQDTIQNLQVRSFESISGLAPNVTLAKSVSGSNPSITIRGMVGGNLANGVDSTVAMYVDGVYIGRSAGAAFEVADLERVEILRGPQGTLYGRNSTGGAVNFITAAPKGEFYARQEVTVGNRGRLRSKTRVDLPKWGAFSISGTFLHDEVDGYIHNSGAGAVWNFEDATRGKVKGDRVSRSMLGGKNVDAGMIAVRYQPESMPITVDYKFDRSKQVSTTTATQLLDSSLAAFIIGSYIRPDLGFGGVAQLVPTPPPLARQGTVNNMYGTPEYLSTFGHSLAATWDIDDAFQFKSITGYRGFTVSTSNPFNGEAPINDFHFLANVIYERSRQFSQEFQLNYSSDAFDAIGGVYYFREKTTSVSPTFIGQFLPVDPLLTNIGPVGSVPSLCSLPQLSDTATYNPGPPDTLSYAVGPNVPGSCAKSNSDATAKNSSAAIYGQTTIHLTESLDFTAGLRYTKDKRETDSRGSFLTWSEIFASGPAAGIPTPSAVYGIRFIQDFKKKFSKLDWTANLTYRPTQDITVYAKAGSGYLSGGVFNGFAFEPEKLIQYEVGAKADLLNRKLRINAAAFYSDYKNLQFAQNNSSGVYVYQNIGKAHINGFEIEATAVPTDFLTVSASYGHVDYDLLVAPAGVTQRSYVAPHTLTLNGDLHFGEFSNGIKPSINVNARWHSDMPLLPGPTNAVNPNFTPNPAVDAFINDNAVWDIDARATLADLPLGDIAKGKLSVWTKNLLNKKTIINATNTGLGIITGNFKEPRTYGIDFSVEF